MKFSYRLWLIWLVLLIESALVLAVAVYWPTFYLSLLAIPAEILLFLSILAFPGIVVCRCLTRKVSKLDLIAAGVMIVLYSSLQYSLPILKEWAFLRNKPAMLAYLQAAPITDSYDPVITQHIPPPLNSNIWYIKMWKDKDGHITAQFTCGVFYAGWIYDSNNSFHDFAGDVLEKNWIISVD